MLPREGILEHAACRCEAGVALVWPLVSLRGREGAAPAEPGAGLTGDFASAPPLFLLLVRLLSPAPLLTEIFHEGFRRH